jgi:hypothetical protein
LAALSLPLPLSLSLSLSLSAGSSESDGEGVVIVIVNNVEDIVNVVVDDGVLTLEASFNLISCLYRSWRWVGRWSRGGHTHNATTIALCSFGEMDLMSGDARTDTQQWRRDARRRKESWNWNPPVRPSCRSTTSTTLQVVHLPVKQRVRNRVPVWNQTST